MAKWLKVTLWIVGIILGIILIGYVAIYVACQQSIDIVF